MKKIILISTLLLAILTLSSIGPSMAKHNTEFPDDDCVAGAEDDTLVVEIYSFYYTVNGHKNPDITLKKGECLLVKTTNHTEIEHDLTVVWDGGTATDDSDDVEMIHMDTPPDGVQIQHRWLILNQALTLEYGCEVEGHHASGMHGALTIGDSFSVPAKEDDSPGFGFEMAMLAFLSVAIMLPILRKRK